MSHHFDRWTTIVRNDEDLEINVEYTATPFVPATYLQPAEGGEIEITAVFFNGVALDPPLSEAEESKVVDYLYESMDDSDFDDGPDWDAEYDRRRDDRLTGGGA